MPRYYPNRDCGFYVERLYDNYHSETPHILRKNPLKNSVCWFRDQDHQDPNRSFICSWGIGDDFKKNTGLNCEKFYKTRIRKSSKIPAAGQIALWRITRDGPCGFGKLPLHTWSFADWLEESSFRESKAPGKEISKSRS